MVICRTPQARVLISRESHYLIVLSNVLREDTGTPLVAMTAVAGSIRVTQYKVNFADCTKGLNTSASYLSVVNIFHLLEFGWGGITQNLAVIDTSGILGCNGTVTIIVRVRFASV